MGPVPLRGPSTRGAMAWKRWSLPVHWPVIFLAEEDQQRLLVMEPWAGGYSFESNDTTVRIGI